jgi:hypothetical protein
MFQSPPNKNQMIQASSSARNIGDVAAPGLLKPQLIWPLGIQKDLHIAVLRSR